MSGRFLHAQGPELAGLPDRLALDADARCIFPGSAGRPGDLLYGFDVGGGMDVALTPNIFVRGEYEYTRFAPTSNVLITVSSARVGGGFKF
jgi:hypothetical protein